MLAGPMPSGSTCDRRTTDGVAGGGGEEQRVMDMFRLEPRLSPESVAFVQGVRHLRNAQCSIRNNREVT